MSTEGQNTKTETDNKPERLSESMRRLVRTFSDYVKATVQILMWSVFGLLFLALASVGLLSIWTGVKIVLKALGI